MHIALIDDDPDILQFLAALLRGQDGHQLSQFTDPSLAFDWCAANDADLVIVDYLMPGMDGVAFIERFRTLPDRADTPVLMLTGDSHRDVRYRALQAGANDFLTKPVDALELLARVKNMLALRRSERRLRDRAAWLAEEVRKATAEIVRREQETIYRLSRAAECRDSDTGAHIQRMAHYSKLIARGLGLTESDQDLILHAAPMHDIGKVGIPDSILLKPGNLTPDEVQIMRSHTLIGHRILSDSDAPLLQMGALIALTHHERFDGSGYPQSLVGESIPIYGRIATVADVFDALASRRPYKGAWSFGDARAYLEKHAGAHFDPTCVHALLSFWDEVTEIAARYPEARSEVGSGA